mgnify:FL=1
MDYNSKVDKALDNRKVYHLLFLFLSIFQRLCTRNLSRFASDNEDRTLGKHKGSNMGPYFYILQAYFYSVRVVNYFHLVPSVPQNLLDCYLEVYEKAWALEDNDNKQALSLDPSFPNLFFKVAYDL